MQCLWLENLKLSYRDNVPVPTPHPGEVLVRVRLAGICSTDLEMVQGYYPFIGIPGHEFVGNVVDGPTDSNWIGSRVVGEINITCGECEACRAGRNTHCERRTVLGILNHHGVFAEYLTLPLENLHRVPDSIPDEAAVFTEPLAAALEIQQQISVHPTDRVLVIGAGRLGQLIAQTLALTGCDLKVVVRRYRQIELLEAYQIQSLAPDEVKPQKWDVVVEATGSPQGLILARQAVRPRGTLVLKSTYHGDIQFNFSSIVVDEITLVGSRCGPFQPALRLLETGQIDPTPMIETSYPLSDGIAAFERAAQPGVFKILLKPPVP